MENIQPLNKLREDHKKLVESGMFWEFYPELSGIWEEDKEEWIAAQKRLEAWREEHKTCQKILEKANLNDKMSLESVWPRFSSTPLTTTIKSNNKSFKSMFYVQTTQNYPYTQLFTNIDGKRELQLVYPGKVKEDFNLYLSGELLNIEVGKYVKEYTIPPDTDKSNISAKYEAGILKISLPVKVKKAKKIEVK